MRRLGVIATGGTVAMTNGGVGAIPTLSAARLAADAFGPWDGVAVEPIQLFGLPSADLGPDRILQLRDAVADLAGRTDGVVVTHGTDTLEESAYALHLLLETQTPVVLTGAMRTPDALGADGPANLAAAGRVALSGVARGAGVLVVMNDEIHAAAHVRKAHASRPSAFSSAPVGPLGWISEDRVRLFLRPAPNLRPMIQAGVRLPHVAVLPLYPDTPADLVRAASEAGEGLVLEVFGAGHAPSAHLDLLARIAASRPVVFASRTGGGETFEATYGFPGGEVSLIARGLIGAAELDARRARLALCLLLSGGASLSRIRDWFQSPADPEPPIGGEFHKP